MRALLFRSLEAVMLVGIAAVGVAVSPTAHGATVGSVINIAGGASDIILDESRQLLYLVRPSPYNRIDIFSTTQRRVVNSVGTDALPLAAALSRDGNTLFVTCHDGSSLNLIDVRANPPRVLGKVSLPAKPEGVAVGADGRVLITTIGSGANNLLNTLLIYDPSETITTNALSTVPVVPPPPLPPQLPPLAGRVFLANRSQLLASKDGSVIIGVNAANQNTRVVFVYEAASGSVLRSRFVGDTSTVLSISPDGSKFMMGLRLFETATLAVLAQQNAANAPFPISTNVTAQGFTQVGGQFNVQQNQGGSVFSVDGQTIYSAFNIVPVQSPAARPNVTQLFMNDADNLLIQEALQMPENLAGKMTITADGENIYALSESGFTILNFGDVRRGLMVQPDRVAAVVASDQCNAAPEGRRTTVGLVSSAAPNAPLAVTSTLLQSLGAVQVPGIGGGLPPGIVLPIVPGVPVGPGGNNNNNQAAQLLAAQPTVRQIREGNRTTGLEFAFNATAARSLGTQASYDYLISSPQAINVPAVVRVYQNARNSEARGEIVPIQTNLSAAEGLTDLQFDAIRQRLYVANSGMNRVEVYDLRQKKLLPPIKVGQLPRSLALNADSIVLYVANTGSEFISIVDLEKMQVSGRIRFPAIPFNGNVPIITPQSIAVTQRGLQIVMSNGTLWRTIGDEAVPRAISPIIGVAAVPAPRTVAATPNGEFMLLLAGNGNAYLYDASIDDYVQARQVATNPIQGFYGPVTAGARGQFFVVNNVVLNQSLSPISGGTTGVGAAARPIAALAAASGNLYARFTHPVQANANAVVTDVAQVELVDINSGQATRTMPALESALARVLGTARTNTDARLLTVDATLSNAYALTTSGISIIPLDVIPNSERPTVNNNGIVNWASYKTQQFAPGSLLTVFGNNMGETATPSTTSLPLNMGGLCVTLNNQALPLLMTSSGQVNAQIPYELAAGRYPLVVRSISRKIASTTTQLTVTKYAPAILVEPQSKQILLFHDDGSYVTRDNPAQRDERLRLYAIGLGLQTKFVGKVTSGAVSPEDPRIETDPLKVYFRKITTAAEIKAAPKAQEEVIVESSTLVPGMVGIYELELRVPGFHEKGPDLQAVIRIGTVDSPLDGPLVPRVAVD